MNLARNQFVVLPRGQGRHDLALREVPSEVRQRLAFGSAEWSLLMRAKLPASHGFQEALDAT